jgi:hypothetical protein
VEKQRAAQAAVYAVAAHAERRGVKQRAEEHRLFAEQLRIFEDIQRDNAIQAFEREEREREQERQAAQDTADRAADLADQRAWQHQMNQEAARAAEERAEAEAEARMRHGGGKKKPQPQPPPHGVCLFGSRDCPAIVHANSLVDFLRSVEVPQPRGFDHTPTLRDVTAIQWLYIVTLCLQCTRVFTTAPPQTARHIRCAVRDSPHMADRLDYAFRDNIGCPDYPGCKAAHHPTAISAAYFATPHTATHVGRKFPSLW